MVSKVWNVYKVVLTFLLILDVVSWLFARSGYFMDLYRQFNASIFVAFGSVSLLHEIVNYIYSRKWHAGTLFLTFALISWGIGELLWYYFSVSVGMELPYPSFADIGYSLFYPLITIGLVIIINKVRNVYTPKIALWGLIGSAFFILLYYLMITRGRFLFVNHPDFYKAFFDITYLIWDAVVLVVFITLVGNIFRYSMMKHFSLPATLIVGAGIFIMLFADLLFSYQTDSGTYQEISFIDLIYLSSAYLVAFGTIRFHDASSLPAST